MKRKRKKAARGIFQETFIYVADVELRFFHFFLGASLDKHLHRNDRMG